MSSGIYSIFCIPTREFYIGGSIDIRRRYREHLYLLRHNRHWSKMFQDTFNLYGEEAFLLELLEECLGDTDKLRIREQEYLDNIFNFDIPTFNTSENAYGPSSNEINAKRSEQRQKYVDENYDTVVAHNKKVGEGLRGKPKTENVLEAMYKGRDEYWRLNEGKRQSHLEDYYNRGKYIIEGR